MSDKKVGRQSYISETGPLTPSKRNEESLSDGGAINAAKPTDSKGKSGLIDRFREREERYRREQALAAERPETPSPEGEEGPTA